MFPGRLDEHEGCFQLPRPSRLAAKRWIKWGLSAQLAGDTLPHRSNSFPIPKQMLRDLMKTKYFLASFRNSHWTLPSANRSHVSDPGYLRSAPDSSNAALTASLVSEVTFTSRTAGAGNFSPLLVRCKRSSSCKALQSLLEIADS